jgi:membrane-associated phospholipid phosphatase
MAKRWETTRNKSLLVLFFRKEHSSPALPGYITPMKFLTDFADQAVALPLAATVLLALLALGWRRGALAWALGVGGVLAVMLLLKLITFACAWRMPWTGLASPSGHTATAAVVYGGLLALLMPGGFRGTLVAAIAGGAFALLFGLTRLALQVHTVPDVIVGAAVGIAGAVILRLLAGDRPPLLSSPRITLAACVVMLLFHGHRLEAETRIRAIALDVWPLTLCRAP